MAKIVLLLPLSKRTSVKCPIVFFHSCFYTCTTHYEHFSIQIKSFCIYLLLFNSFSFHLLYTDKLSHLNGFYSFLWVNQVYFTNLLMKEFMFLLTC